MTIKESLKHLLEKRGVNIPKDENISIGKMIAALAGIDITERRSVSIASMIDVLADNGSGQVAPTGTITIAYNGTYDVAEFAFAKVNISSESSAIPLKITASGRGITVLNPLYVGGEYNLVSNDPDGYGAIDGIGGTVPNVFVDIQEGESKTISVPAVYATQSSIDGKSSFSGKIIYHYFLLVRCTGSQNTLSVVSNMGDQRGSAYVVGTVAYDNMLYGIIGVSSYGRKGRVQSDASRAITITVSEPTL